MATISQYRHTKRDFAGLAPLRVACAAAALAVSGCASLPTSGPTLHQVIKESQSGVTIVPFTLTPLDADALRNVPSFSDPAIAKLATLGRQPGPVRADLIRPGDTLSISVFEVGISLFSGSGAPPTGGGAVQRMPSAGTQTLSVVVRENGFIDIPYAGSVMAAGAYPEELAAVIRRHLKSLSENPEVSVSIADSVANVVYLSGVVTKSGRFHLTAAHERLLDAIAIAGGSTVDPNELQVRLQRGDSDVTAPLNQINSGDPADVVIHPGDRVQLVRLRPSYTVFGASDKISQVYFEAKDVSLAEAIARAAGPSDFRANPRGVFLCRYETSPDGHLKPVVYQLNMMKMDAYFLAQKFPVRDKDVILFANSSGTLTQKLVGLLGSLFAPVATVRYAASN